MGSDDVEKALVFIDSNIDTHFCIAPPLDTTVKEVKKSIEETHFSIYPEKGEVQVRKLLMKYEEQFYVLGNSVTTRSIFPGVKEPWYLRVEMMEPSTPDPSHLSNHLALVPVDEAATDRPVDDNGKAPKKQVVDSLPLKRQMKSLLKRPKKISKRKKKALAHDDDDDTLKLKVLSVAENGIQCNGYVSDSDV